MGLINSAKWNVEFNGKQTKIRNQGVVTVAARKNWQQKSSNWWWSSEREQQTNFAGIFTIGIAPYDLQLTFEVNCLQGANVLQMFSKITKYSMNPWFYSIAFWFKYQVLQQFYTLSIEKGKKSKISKNIPETKLLLVGFRIKNYSIQQKKSWNQKLY